MRLQRCTKEECDKDYSEKNLEMSDEKCSSCEYFNTCRYQLIALNEIVYGTDDC